jgi:tRNA modification GTPase
MLGDTIVARASAAGSSERAVVRVSGPRAFVVVGAVWVGVLPERRGAFAGRVRVRGREVEALALVFVCPSSFTGEDVVELHVAGSAMLVEALLAELLADGAARGVRAALAGEFTARAVQHGKLPAAAVEGLLLLLHATDRSAAAAAAAWLHGGACADVATLRERVQDVLALLEAGLDFGDGETGAVPDVEWRTPLRVVHDRLAALAATLPAAAPGGELLLLGAANAGKSSLANALAGRAAALVDATAGTTRDLLRVELPGGGVLWDAPGDFAGAGDADVEALVSRDRLGAGAAGHLLVLDATAPHVPLAALTATTPRAAIVWTKCDRVAAPPPLSTVLPGELV